MKVILDCNIYDKLNEREDFVSVIRELVEKNRLSVMVNPTLWREIEKSPHVALARSIPVIAIGESVMVAGGQVGDRVGSGNLYRAHYGVSNKYSDALISDAAQHEADYLVTEDSRCRKRMNEFSVRARGVTFEEFEIAIKNHVGT